MPLTIIFIEIVYMSYLTLESETLISRQQDLLDHLPVAILIADKKGQIHYYNQEAERIFSHHILTHTKVTDLSNDFSRKNFNDALHSLDKSTPFTSPLILKHRIKYRKTDYQLKIINNPDNTIINDNSYNNYYLLTFSPFSDPLSKSDQMSTIKKNFKELKQFSRLSAMREISSSLADKLNQPLTAILSYTQAMQRLYQNNASSEDIKNAMSRVVVNAENAGNIIRDVRSQLKVNTLNYEMTCINDLIQQSIHLTDLDNLHSIIQLKTHYEPQFSSICIDAIQIRQVIFSLLNNAIDAVSEAAIEAPEINITTRKESSFYTIIISDNGPGLPDNIKNQLFEPFRTTKKQGIGIGLSMSHHIIELHKGNISIQSDKQIATSVTIRLPISRNNDYCQP